MNKTQFLTCMSSTLSSLCTFSLDMLLGTPCGSRFQWSGSRPDLSFSGQNQKRQGLWPDIQFWGSVFCLFWYDTVPQKHTLPCKVFLRKKTPPTWWYQNSTRHFYWRICGSLDILERTTSVAIYRQYEPVNAKRVTISSRTVTPT